MGCGTSKNSLGGNTIQVAPAPSPSALRHTSLDSVHVSNNGSGSSKSKIHVRSNSSPASNETSQQLSRPISRISGRPSGGDNALNSSHGSASLSSKLGTQSRPPSRPHSHVSRAYSRITHRPTTGRFNQWDSSTPGNILELSGYHGNTSQLSTCAHCDHPFTTAGLRVPLLLLCGHTYCTNCIEKACSTYPSAIRCGQCHTNTPVDQQGAAHMMQNEALLEVLDNKQLQQSLPAQQRGRDTCAECERQPAIIYCSNCSAAFCAPCSHKSHAGSKVRGKHTPVPITQRPQPNPTCKRHPGQTCMLYCETEGVPMCVLCKFYGQHRYHKYELLSKVAAKQSGLLIDKQQALQRLERHFGNMSKQLSTAVDDITIKARQSQQILEDHFSELRGQILALLERREAILLSQLDQQVELKQEMLQEQREEVAIALSKVMACQEEVMKLQKLLPITSLLAGRHLEQVFTAITMDTYHVPQQITNQPEVPLSLIPDVTPQVTQLLQQHGAVLQLPNCPNFTVVIVTSNNISLQWSLSDTEDVTKDTTINYSLEYHSKLPITITRYNSSRKSHMTSVESGFDDTSTNSSSDYKSSQWGGNISMVTASSTPHKGSHDPDIPEHCDEGKPRRLADLLDANGKDVISSLLPVPVYLPTKPGELPAIVTTVTKPTRQDSSSVLNLPPLKSSVAAIPPVDHVSNTTSGVFAESEDSVPMATRTRGETPTSDDDSNISTHTSNYTNIGRHSNGMQFEEIYHGNATQYNYSNTVNGACYYFRLRCHNAAGWGPYSDIIKCTVND